MIEPHEHKEYDIHFQHMEEHIDKIEETQKREIGIRERIYERIEILERKEAATSVEYSHILSALDELKKDVRELKEKPNKRYETFIAAAITTIVGGILGAIVAFIITNLPK